MNDFLKKALPWIGAAATGNVPALVAMAASQLSQSFGTDIAPTADAIVKAVQGATPEQMMAMKQADNDFATKMQAMGFAHLEELEKVAANDRDSARRREETVQDWTPRMLAYGVTIGFFGLLAFIATGNLAPGSTQILDVMVGTLGTSWVGIITYYFGSSAGSDKKTELLAKAPAITNPSTDSGQN